jgi:hypothetical protein
MGIQAAAMARSILANQALYLKPSRPGGSNRRDIRVAPFWGDAAGARVEGTPAASSVTQPWLTSNDQQICTVGGHCGCCTRLKPTCDYRLSPCPLCSRCVLPFCMAQDPTQHPAPNYSAAVLVAELARQRRDKGALGPCFDVIDLRHVVISGPVDLVALAEAAASV